MFIVFEGLDGSGSTTQAKFLSEYFKKIKKEVLLTKEPTNDLPIGKLIRKYLQKEYQTTPYALQLLFAADRLDHLEQEITPALKDKKIVISDRYLYSSIAFGSSEKISFSYLEKLYQDFLKPDYVFLLKVPPEECIKRIEKRKGKKEYFEKKEILEKVWKNYEKLAKNNDNFYIIDAYSKEKFETAKYIQSFFK
jgi:dTMP kinase